MEIIVEGVIILYYQVFVYGYVVVFQCGFVIGVVFV